MLKLLASLALRSAWSLPFVLASALAQVPVQVVPPAAPTPAPNAAPHAAGAAPGAAVATASTAQDAKSAKDGDKPKRKGIPVEDPLVHTHCARCHALDAEQLMTRISFLRKSPEGWSESLKRMVRLHGLQISPSDAKQVVRSLANSHGLARSEAERGLYESERRVHWSEDAQDQDFRRACAECHPLGRVLLQQRDEEEWQLLRSTHVAMFPLARGQMGGGPPPEEERRRGPGGPGGPQGAGGGQGPSGGPTQGVGDRVLSRLAKDQPLFTDAWDRWQKHRREVPLAGTWTVTGHETGLGDLFGTATLVRTDADEYDVVWELRFANGSQVRRTGKGLLYAGYSWRGRAAAAGDGAASWREVLLLDERWQTLRGRLFTGNYDELGADVTLHRPGAPRILALGNAALEVPSRGHRLVAYGSGFPAAVAPADLFVGSGLTVQQVERVSDRELVLVVDVAAGTELGTRQVVFGSEPEGPTVRLYDTVDYVRITPLQGLARIGGAKHPKQLERFEAFAMHRGPDGKPYTSDDVTLFQVWPQWGLEEFKVREQDDDVQYVGAIDPASGVFTPAIDGPNPARKWTANNIGDVFVTAVVELDVPVRPEPKGKDGKAAAGKPAAGKPGDAPAGDGKPEVVPSAAQPPTPPAVPARVKKSFRARSHLIVTVPLYARWQALDWEDR
ncbi:MAG: quinohemoprotein amine dehydrogenase subunit alpha [Planctomycetes bacterium]|nr:quinohemoprotein amine dehydrogenase subunit alpha [Planctomycetota bacterium]